ncbi:MAG: hypothetical protein WB609_00950 [Candidatus Cybelea sp.]
MKWSGTIAFAIGSTLVAVLAVATAPPAAAQTAESSLKQSCHDATRAFTLRQIGTEELAVADPSAIGKLRQSALLFYRCAQSEPDPYMHVLFLAYYANTLYRVGQNANDPRATSLAEATAQRLQSSGFDDVRALVATVSAPSHHDASAPAKPPKAITNSAAYCHDLEPNVVRVLDEVDTAVLLANNAGYKDTEVLAQTTARYGDAFKVVEDDYTSVETHLQRANTAYGLATEAATELNDQEKPAVTRALSLMSGTMSYVDTYSRLALEFERGMNAANRRLAYARISAALAAGMHNSSYTYSNGNASCYSYSANSTNCYGNSYSTTTYNNSASIAQQNAANALAAAQSGRLSYGQADQVLTEGLPILSQIDTALESAEISWDKVCDAGQ